jgi:OmpR-family two-component system manganese-sensing response regulator
MAKILLVEDYENLQKIYQSALLLDGHTVDIAQDGLKAFDMASAEGYDLIILDIVLPKKSGLEFLREFVPKERKPSVKVIAISNVQTTENVSAANKYGVDRFLEKAHTTPDKLRFEVSQLVNKRSD